MLPPTVPVNVRRRIARALTCVVLMIGCVGSVDEDPPADAIEPAAMAAAPREQESLEFSGRLPVTLLGVNATSGTSRFTADFGRVGNWTTIEITISVDRIKAPGYEMILRAEGREISSRFDSLEPHVFHTDFDGPYEIDIRARGPDIEGSSWAANVTLYYRE